MQQLKHTTQTIAHAYASAYGSFDNVSLYAGILQACIRAGVLPVIVDDSGARKKQFLDASGFLRASLFLSMKEADIPVMGMKNLAAAFDSIPLYDANEKLISKDGMRFIIEDDRPHDFYLIIEKQHFALSASADYHFTNSEIRIVVNISQLFKIMSAHDFKNRCFVRDFEA